MFNIESIFNIVAFAFWQELEEQLAEQKKLLQSVASRGEEILIKQASPSSARYQPISRRLLDT